MTTWIALLRGINVGGRHALPMAQLRAGAESLGLREVRTYIQSGNCVFNSDASDTEQAARALAAALTQEIEHRAGFAPHVLVRSLVDLEAVLAQNPYPAAAADPKSLHVFFLDEAPSNPDLDALDALRQDGEVFTLRGRVFYLFAPAGIGRSRLATKVERHIPVQMTARNLRSVERILELARRVRDAEA